MVCVKNTKQTVAFEVFTLEEGLSFFHLCKTKNMFVMLKDKHALLGLIALFHYFIHSSTNTELQYNIQYFTDWVTEYCRHNTAPHKEAVCPS